ncbi:unnamed protein product [Caenorhabditis nigoni]
MSIPVDPFQWRTDLHKVKEQLFVHRFRKCGPNEEENWTPEQVAIIGNVLLETFKHYLDLRDINTAIYIVDHHLIDFRKPENSYKLLVDWDSEEWWKNVEKSPEMSIKLLRKCVEALPLDILLDITRNIFAAVPMRGLYSIVKFANEFLKLTFGRVSVVLTPEERKEAMSQLKGRSNCSIPFSEMYLDLWRICWHEMPHHLRTPEILISGISVPIPEVMTVDAYFLEFLNENNFARYHKSKTNPEEKVAILKFLTCLNFHDLNYYFVTRHGKRVLENLSNNILQIDPDYDEDDFLQELRNFVVKASAHVVEFGGENLRDLLENIADSLFDKMGRLQKYMEILIEMHLASNREIFIGDRNRTYFSAVNNFGSETGFKLLTLIVEMDDSKLEHEDRNLENLMSYDQSPAVFDPRQHGSIKKWLAMASFYELNTWDPRGNLYTWGVDFVYGGSKWTHDTFPSFFHLLTATARSLIGKYYDEHCLEDPQILHRKGDSGLVIFDYLVDYSLQFILMILVDKHAILKPILGSEHAEKIYPVQNGWMEWKNGTKLRKKEIEMFEESTGRIVEDYMSGENTTLEDFVNPLVDMFTTVMEIYDFPKSYREYGSRSYHKDCYSVVVRPLLVIMPLKALKIIVAYARCALRITLSAAGKGNEKPYQADWQRVRDTFTGDFSREFFKKFPQTAVEFYSNLDSSPKTWIEEVIVEKNVAAVVNFHKIYDYPEVLDYLVVCHYFKQIELGGWTKKDWAKNTDVKTILVGKNVNFHL